MVLVQVPMYNEREVYQLSIGAACGLSSWYLFLTSTGYPVEFFMRDVKTRDVACYLALKVSKSKMHRDFWGF
ncbi:hypothetical protein VIGAN_03190100 [Vigna angularis var. angularis]|uniref:Uncharacterized protein n=1 Tax=Vigna angularis var. angularis TaxID=157739 RepID=A0A0S3RMY5_PHAAN|nr:hypothetical protein VIGAN_03190100 [Vigna angularis var. angularis]